MTRFRAFTSLLAFVLFSPVAPAQEAAPGRDLLPPTNQHLFARLDLPAPNVYRSADGRPGPSYWQQRNDYRIEVELDTTTHTISGVVHLTYTNNSPQALDHLWFHLEQNLFAPDSRGAALTPAGSRWEGAFEGGGFALGDVTVGGLTVEPIVTDTRMRLDLPQPLAAAGGQVQVTVPYSFVVPEYGADRMGRLEAARGTVYEIAQWYPRVAVYDDVNGWNTMPYLGQGEFYLGYGDFEVEITVPTGMTVVATGSQTNANQTFSGEVRERLEDARSSDERVYIIRPEEVGSDDLYPQDSPVTIWRFTAHQVRDFAWAASKAFILDGAGATIESGAGPPNNVLILSAYPHEGVGTGENPGWEEATEYGRASIINNSRWLPYPYPVAISVAGVVGGMEYPMLHFSGVDARHMSLFGVIDHELGHNWFPMIVGSDERRYAWMDEGFNTYLNTFSGATYYDEQRDDDRVGANQSDSLRVIRLTRGAAAANFAAQPYAIDQPALLYPDHIRRAALGWLAYRKPGKGLLLLRNYVIGPERFDAAFKEYIRRWTYKHPQPADFFRTIEDVTGEDLDWFWRGWFMGMGRYDAAIASVELETAEDGRTYAVATVENRQVMVFPVVVEFVFSDDSVERVQIPVEEFATSDTATATVSPNDRAITSVRLDPNRLLPDENRGNDVTSVARE